MSLSSILKSASSGLMTAQTGLRTVSDNISNVNTPGYVRKVINQQQLVVAGAGAGVEVKDITRVTDQYLQLASLTAASDASRWDVTSQFLDNAQSLFGDPSADSFFFNRLDEIFANFSSAADDPSSALLRTQAVSTTQDFLGEADRINTQINQLGQTVDTRVIDSVARANELLGQINKLNGDIGRAKVVNSDSSGSENIQAQLLDELSTLMSVKVDGRANGGVNVRSPEGVLLAGDTAATLTYVRTDSTRGYIAAQTGTTGNPQPIQVNGGEIRGLLDLRDDKLPGLSDQLGEFMSRAAERLNAAHNASTAFPAPTSLTGRDTGLDLPTAVSGFSGTSTVAIVNAAGVVQRRVAIDFTAGTMSVDGGAPGAFTPANFLTQLNAGLGALGTASFNAGKLSIAATGTNGVAIDEGTSLKAGRAFSHFFGLNDLIRSTGISSYETGLKATDNHGFTPGDTMVLRLAQPNGLPIRDVTITVPAAPLMSDLLNTLNAASTGVGVYGQFSLDGSGALTFKGSAPLNANLSIVQDDTKRGVGGPPISQLFGLGVAVRSARAGQFDVDPTLVTNPAKLAFGKLDLSVAAGTPAIRAGDGRGALALSQAGDVSSNFQAAGALGQVAMTVSHYGAELAGAIGRDAAAADTRSQSAAAVQTEATARRQSVEGVNLDEELVRLTTYQQAFNASARMISATKDLFDVLLGII
ncbi:MAG: flaN [Phenylobacterium sp.]|nr:flaN [Phenylobacterium sp.]